MKQKRETRYRNFTAIIYPDSVVSDWEEKLIQSHIQCIVSPLHDKDINPDGESKKAHRHVMIMYDSPTTLERAQELFDSIGATKCQIVNSTRGTARYFLHLDNPEKAQYARSDLKALNGVDYDELIKLASDDRKTIKEILKFIRQENVIAYIDLLEYCEAYEEDWFQLIYNKHTLAITQAIKSQAWKLEKLGTLENPLMKLKESKEENSEGSQKNDIENNEVKDENKEV